MGLALTPDRLRRLSKQDFERFCDVLIDADYRTRFAAGAVEMDGPHFEDLGDGGVDIRAIIKEPAGKHAYHPLLRDDRGEIIFSCKSHKDSSEQSPRGWIAQVRDAIDPSPRVYDATRKAPAPDAEERAKQTKEPLQQLLRKVCSGAHYCVLVNVPWGHRLEVAQEIALRLRLRAKLLLGNEVDVRDDQVRVLTANEIIKAFTERPCAVPPDLEQKLGGTDDDFRDWSTWTDHISNERRRLDFVHDEHREALYEQLDLMIDDQGPSSIWIVGAPGVGKTRTVHHFFERHAELHSRIRQTDEWEEAELWIRRDGPRSMRDAIVIVDEVPSTRGDDLARDFRRAHETRVKLVMIGTGIHGQGTTTKVFPLERLAADEFRSLIEAELDKAGLHGPSRGRIIAVVEHLSQGYPLFAMWLARGLANNPELLDEPGTGLTNEQDPWLATRLVLESRSKDASEAEWTEVADRRGRALLLAMLVPDDPWTFSPELEQQFERALGYTWRELEEAARDCSERGILRQTRHGALYISPANLERLILNHYFGGTPPPIPPGRLRARLGARVDGLLDRAQRAHASAVCRSNLASALLDPTLEELRGGARGQGLLLRIARELPAELARRAHADALRTGPGSLFSEELADVFGHLRHRAIDPEAFALVEDALFALRRVEDWSSIFSCGFHATYQPFELRLGLLEARSSSEDPGQRLRAIAGLRMASDPSGGPGTNVGLDDIDAATAGPWESPSIEECASRAARGWALLLRAANDGNSEVSSAARHELTKGLRQGLEFGLWARPKLIDDLVGMVHGWTPSQRNALDAEIDEVERSDGGRLKGAPPAQQDALRSLRAALLPSTFKERLMARVGRWHPVSGHPISGHEPDQPHLETEDDRALARELIATPNALVDVRDWLDSREAVRGTAFGWVLGEVDEKLVLLAPLRAGAESGSLGSVFASYLAAWAARAPSAFDAWIEEHSVRSGLGDAIAAAIIGSKSSPARATVLTKMVRRGIVHPPALRGLGSWGWSKGLPTDVLDRLLTALVDTGDVMMARPAVGLAQERLEGAPVDPAIASHLVRLVNETRSVHLPGTGERSWAFVVLALVEGGHAEALDVIVDAITDVGHSHQAEAAIQELLRRGHVVELWQHMAPRLAEEPLVANRVATITKRTSFREQLPVDEVLAWVGRDLERAVTAARLTRPYARVLDPLAVAVIERFGADAEPAQQVATRASSTPAAVNGFARFFDRQADHASAWERDNEGEVARWAQTLASELRGRAAAEREEDELSRKLASQ